MGVFLLFLLAAPGAGDPARCVAGTQLRFSFGSFLPQLRDHYGALAVAYCSDGALSGHWIGLFSCFVFLFGGRGCGFEFFGVSLW